MNVREGFMCNYSRGSFARSSAARRFFVGATAAAGTMAVAWAVPLSRARLNVGLFAGNFRDHLTAFFQPVDAHGNHHVARLQAGGDLGLVAFDSAHGDGT